MINNFFIFLSKKQSYYFFILSIALAFSAVLEIIGIGLIPIFVSVVIDYELLNNYLIKLNLPNLNFIAQMEQDELLIFININIQIN